MPAVPDGRRRLAALAGALLALAAQGCSVWQLGDEAPSYVDAASHRGVDVLAFDAESRTLASGGWDGEIALWTLGRAKPDRVWKAHDGAAQGLDFHGEALISGGQDGRLILWSRNAAALASVDTGSPITHVQVMNALAVTGHYDGSVRSWSLPRLQPLMHLELHRGALVAALAVDTGSGRIASSSYDGSVYLIEADGRYRELQRPPTDARSLSFTPGGRRLFGGGWGRLYLWTPDAGRFETLSTPHWGTIAALQYLPGENVLASISRINDSSVFFLDPATGEGVRHFQRQSVCGSAVRVSPDERYLAASGDDGLVRVWDLSGITR